MALVAVSIILLSVPALAGGQKRSKGTAGTQPSMEERCARLEPAANLKGCQLAERDLRGLDLRGADLRHADLSFADLRGANLSQAWLDRADLSFVQAAGVDLSLASLQNADLRLADLSGANLTTADLRNSDLSSAITAGAMLSGSNWAGVVCPSGALAGLDSRCGRPSLVALVEPANAPVPNSQRVP